MNISLILDILSRKKRVVRWQKASGGNFDVLIHDFGSDRHSPNTLLRQELNAVDVRLGHVLEYIVHQRFDNTEVQNLLAYTYGSLWAKSNKLYRPEKNDGLYRSLLSEDKQDKWYVEKFVRVIPDFHLSDWMRIVVNVYATSETLSGIPYVNDIQTTQLSRSTEWLDNYIENGATYLQLLRALDTPEDELAGKLQEQYLHECSKAQFSQPLVNVPFDLTS